MLSILVYSHHFCAHAQYPELKLFCHIFHSFIHYSLFCLVLTFSRHEHAISHATNMEEIKKVAQTILEFRAHFSRSLKPALQLLSSVLGTMKIQLILFY